MRAIPWICAVLLAVLSLYLLVERPTLEEVVTEEAALQAVNERGAGGEEPAASTGQGTPVVPVGPSCPDCPSCGDPEQVRAVAQCLARLGTVKEALTRCLADAALLRGRTEPDREACLTVPAVQRLVEEAREKSFPLEAQVSECLDHERLRHSRHHTLRTLLEEDLELLPDEVDWLAEFACALRELRWASVAAMHDDGVRTSEVREMMLGERTEILRDIEVFLGSETYARFRQMGGIGLLNDTLDCSDEVIR